MMNKGPVVNRETHIHEEPIVPGCRNYLSWTAIVAGAFVAIGISFLFDLFGMGIGLSAYSVTTTQTGANALAFGGYVAMVLAGMIAMFAGGWVSGYIGRPTCIQGCHGILYGFITWCLALILSFILVAYAADFMTFQYRALTNSNISNFTTTSNTAMPSFSPTGRNAAGAANTGGGRNTEVNVNDEQAAKETAKTVLMLFLLFFAGALASAFGGYTAVKRCRYYDEKTEYVKR